MFIDLFMMLFSGYLTLIVPFWMLPLTVITGLVTAKRVIYRLRQQHTGK